MQRLKIYAILLSAITISYFGGISLKQKIRTLTTAAIIAAAYAALTLLLAPISYGAVQFRVSEALTVLPFFTPAAVPGLFVGCLVANLIAGVNPVDFVVGSGATLFAALLSYLLGRRSRWLVPLPPVLINAVAIGLELWLFVDGERTLPMLFATMGTVGLGQLAVCYGLGMPLLSLLDRHREALGFRPR